MVLKIGLDWLVVDPIGWTENQPPVWSKKNPKNHSKPAKISQKPRIEANLILPLSNFLNHAIGS